MAEALHQVIDAHPLPEQVRRLTATVAGSSGAVMHHHFTFRPSPTGMTEDRLIRGLHPYIAQRMQMERLSRFDLTRLPSSDEEVYLFQCVARENPSDDRLVAFAQVRDLKELRDHEGGCSRCRRPSTPSPPASTPSAARRPGGRPRSGSPPTGS